MPLLLLLLLLFAQPLMAAEPAAPPPPVPEAVAALQTEGSTAIYVGEADGYGLWLLDGPTQQRMVYWQKAENRALFGPVYNAAGEPVGVKELLEAQMAGRLPELRPDPAKSVGGKFWRELTALSPLAYGPQDAPPLYVLMDPNCPYCHQFDADARRAQAEGKVFRLLILPVAILGADSRDKAIRILASPDPAAAWLAFMQDKSLPPPPGEAEAAAAAQKLEANMALMLRWKFTMVPHLQWQENGRTMLVRGNPNDLAGLWLRLKQR